MKRNGVVGGLFAAVITLWLALGHAQPEPINLEGLELIPAGQVPLHGSFWSVANPNSPPCPAFTLRDLGPDAPPVYALGPLGEFLVDDRGVDYSAFGPLSPSENGPQSLTAGADFGCGLWLNISAITNNASSVLLTLHNTRLSQTYTIWSITNLALTNWVVETNVAGARGDFTEILIAKGGRSNLFFRASEVRDYLLDTNSTFIGLGYSDTREDPPDSMGAVGPSHYVELLNYSPSTGEAIAGIAVYDKSGHLLAKTNTFDFFRYDADHPGGQFTADARILYDSQAQRWVACAIDGGSREVILAVSNGDSPTNLSTGWTKHLLHVNRDGLLTDFTTLGLDGNGLYVRVLHFGNTNGGHTVVAIKKPDIYQGALITSLLTVTSSPPVWTIQPAVNFDPVPTNAYAWFVAKGPPDISSNYQGGAIWYHRLQWNGTNAAWAETNWLVLPDPPTSYRDYYDLDGTNYDLQPGFGTAIFAPQLGETNAITLHDVGSRLAMTVIRSGALWTCQAVGLDNTNGLYSGDRLGATVNRSGVQWLKLDVDAATGTLSYNKHGRIYDKPAGNPYWYYFPSLAVNCAGDMVAGFSGSSLTNYIGAFYSWRLANGSALEAPRVIRAGLTTYVTARRWGDFSATCLDPLDDWAFWTVQQYADPTGAEEGGEYPWKTVIAKLRPFP